LTALRHGDGTFDFHGFGENFQALQLEVGAHIRKTHQKELAEILQDLLKDFSKEFQTPKDMQKLEHYQSAYEKKLEQEKDEIFNVKNIAFSDDIPEGKIALGKTPREVLEVEAGDTVKIGDRELKVMMMKSADMKSGKTMMMNKKYEGTVGEKLEIEVTDKKETKAAREKNGQNAVPAPAPAEPADKDESAKNEPAKKDEEAKFSWKKVGKRIKNLFGSVIDKIKSVLGPGR
jgi:hypothetical protein